MTSLRNRIKLRISDRLAVMAALVLILTASVGSVDDAQAPTEALAKPMHASIEADPTSDDATQRKSATSGLLLFRRG